MPCLLSIALCGQLETIYWEAAGAIIPENNEWCRWRNNGERHLSVVWLHASYRIIRTWKEECSSPTNIWVVWVWVQQEPGAKMGWHVGKEPVTGERAPMHCQLQLLEGQFSFLLHVASRCNRGSRPSKLSSSSYQLISSWRAKQLPLCMCVMASLLKKWFIIYQQEVLGKWRACTFILHDSWKMVVNFQSVKEVIIILSIQSNLRKLIQRDMRWWKGEELGCWSWPAVVSQGQG